MTVRWKLLAFSAEIASGVAAPSASRPGLAIEVPPAARRFPATLSIRGAGPEEIRVGVEVVPGRAAEIRALLAGERIGVVGPVPADRFGAEAVALENPGSIRRFPGRLILLAPGAWRIADLVPALLERVRGGARVLDLGADLAPWVAPEGEKPGGELARSHALLPGDGNHRESRDGLVREGYPGSGRLVLTRLTLAECRDEDPLAEELLLDLLERALAPVPELRPPLAVVVGEDDEELAGLFTPGEKGGEEGTATIVSVNATGARERAKRSAPALLVGPERTVRFDGGTFEEGPGFSDRPAFLR